MVLFSGLAKQVGLEDALREAFPFKPTSPNATDPVEIALAFMASVLAGARRLAHIERLRWDEGMREILGVDRIVSDTTLGRFFRLFKAGTVTVVFEKLMRWQLKMVDVKDDVLDLIFEKYGHEQKCRNAPPVQFGRNTGGSPVQYIRKHVRSTRP